MYTTRLLGAAAAVALLAGAANAQTPEPTPAKPATVPAASPAAQPAPPATAPAPTPAVTAAPAPAATTPAPAVAAVPATPAAAPATAQLAPKGDIVDTLKGNPQFTTLVKALDGANLTEVLKKNSGLTVFAPTNAAFAALPAGELDRLMKDPPALQKLLTYHVVNATVDSSKIKGAKGGVKTVAGTELTVDGSGTSLLANNATIVQADVKATNGTVHVIDRVLAPGATPSVAATTGATSDAAATAPATPAARPPAATPPASAPAAPPPIADEPDASPAQEPTPPAVPPKL